MKEVWVDIVGYEGYYKCSNMGGITSVDRYVKHYRSKSGFMKRVGKKVATHKDKDGYSKVSLSKNGVTKTKCLHRLIFHSFNGFLPKLIDHINNIRDDNTLSNLRSVNITQNNHNRMASKNKTSIYKGVSYSKSMKKWKCQIGIVGKNKDFHLGYFALEIDAANAYDKKAREIHKEYARLNFPSKTEKGCL